MEKVLASVKKVVSANQFVRINKKALSLFCQEFFINQNKLPPWDNYHHFFDGGIDTVAYLLVLDSLNFCFWPSGNNAKWEFEYNSKKTSGYNAMAIALKRAIQSKNKIIHPEYLATLSMDQLKETLGPCGNLQLMEQRVRALNDLGRLLIERYRGKPHLLVEAANNSAMTLVGLLADQLVSFQDIAIYDNQHVFFLKRAQIFVSDLFGAFNGKKWGFFDDISQLTAFADYKLPQVLRQIDILEYNKILSEKVDKKILLEPGSPEEVEIRANTIWAVELIRRELNGMGKKLMAIEIDWLLWNLGQDNKYRIKPYHRTLTCFY